MCRKRDREEREEVPILENVKKERGGESKSKASLCKTSPQTQQTSQQTEGQGSVHSHA